MSVERSKVKNFSIGACGTCPSMIVVSSDHLIPLLLDAPVFFRLLQIEQMACAGMSRLVTNLPFYNDAQGISSVHFDPLGNIMRCTMPYLARQDINTGDWVTVRSSLLPVLYNLAISSGRILISST
jgi:hypothetical protein